MYIAYTCIPTASYAWMLTQTEREKKYDNEKSPMGIGSVHCTRVQLWRPKNNKNKHDDQTQYLLPSLVPNH